MLRKSERVVELSHIFLFKKTFIVLSVITTNLWFYDLKEVRAFADMDMGEDNIIRILWQKGSCKELSFCTPCGPS